MASTTWGAEAAAKMDAVCRNYVLKAFMEHHNVDKERLGCFKEKDYELIDPRGLQFNERKTGNLEKAECMRCLLPKPLVQVMPCGHRPFCAQCMEKWVNTVRQGGAWMCLLCDADVQD